MRNPHFITEFFLERFMLVKRLAEEALECARREREIRDILGLVS